MLMFPGTVVAAVTGVDTLTSRSIGAAPVAATAAVRER